MSSPYKRIGIVGGGQLGRYLTLAAKDLGFHVTVLDPQEDSPAGQVADTQILGDFTNAEKIEELAKESDVMTFEIESSNADALMQLKEKGMIIEPSPETLVIIRNKYAQKKFLSEKNIPLADFVEVKSAADIEVFATKHNYPVVLKTSFGGYDGKGNLTVYSQEDIPSALEQFEGKELYVEAFVPFVKELAVVAVRDLKGSVKTYPVVQTIHKDHICDTVIAPAPVGEDVKQKAADLAEKIMQAFGGAGVFGIEMFLTENGEVIINEIAPRVHNSGHFTMDGSVTSQFEQHIRAIIGMELGDTSMKHPYAVMINILGDHDGAAIPEGIEAAEALGGVKVHIYGKKETRVKRKMGHLNAVGDDLDAVIHLAEQARSLITM